MWAPEATGKSELRGGNPFMLSNIPLSGNKLVAKYLSLWVVWFSAFKAGNISLTSDLC